MKKRNRCKIFISLLAFFLTSKAHSQGNYLYKTQLDKVVAKGFYKIDLPPKLVAKCKDDLEDIRIFDEHGVQVPYFLKEDLPAFKKEYFAEFPVIKFAKEKDKQTHVILENISGHAINNLLLFIKNMDASRSVSLTGSDDSIHWFIIKENIYLQNTFSNDGDNIVNTLSFPNSNYRYFQLTILGENVIPFRIIKAGIYKEDILYGKYVALPKPVIIQKDSLYKKSYVQVKFDDSYQINKIIIEADGPKYFKRNISIINKNQSYYDDIADGYLVSDSINNFPINIKTSRLSLIINNQDNTPLKISSVSAFQLNISLITYLQPGKSYNIYFGDSTATAPIYDLQFFKDTLEKNPVNLLMGGIEKNTEIKNTSNASSSNSTLMLWLIIIAVLIVLSFFTFKMMKEMDRKKTKDL